MSEKVGTCQYPKCNRKALPDSENNYCICHEQKDDKDIEAFNREIEKIMKLESYDFIGFYFPEKFDFEFIYKHLKDRTFGKKVDFSDAIFNCEANFEKIKFKNSTVFSGVKFKEGANFRNAEFKKISNFEDTIFKEWADFVRAVFEKKANFWHAQFKKGGDFRRARFEEKAYFPSVEFQEADFSYTTLKQADFIYAKFRGEANFGHARFQVAEFYYAVSEKKADFWKCSVTKRISFSSATFYDILSLVDIEGKKHRLDFGYTGFSDKTWIGAGTDLKNAIFNFSRVELVDFTGAKFPEKIYEERLLEKKFHGRLNTEEEDYCPESWEEVSTICRKLKQAHVKYGIADKAEDFGYREWECNRKSKKETKSFEKYFLYTIFKYWLGYGKKPKQLLYSAIFIIFLFSFLYLSTGIEVYNQEDNVYDVFDNCSAPLDRCFYFSVITFTTVGYGDIHPYGNWARGVAMAEAAIGIFMMAFFVATFARRFV